MFPFDRLIRVMDDWTQRARRNDVFAQIGKGAYEPTHMRWTRRLSPAEFAEMVGKADLVVAHAGMGTVITASDQGKPVVLLPRLEKWGEHTTDHQMDTAHWLKDRPGVYVAMTDGEELDARIAEALRDGLTGEMLRKEADPNFLERITRALLE